MHISKAVPALLLLATGITTIHGQPDPEAAITSGRIPGATSEVVQEGELPVTSTGNVRVSLRGAQAPESDAIAFLLNSPPRNITASMSAAERLQFHSGRTAALDRSKTRLELETFCRKLLAEGAAADPARTAERLSEIQDRENEYMVESYQAMLARLSPESREALQRKKSAIHSGLASNHADFLTESRVDPEGFIARRLGDCDRM